MKKNHTKYASIYLAEGSDPVIVVCDRKSDAMKDASDALLESLADTRDTEGNRGALTRLRKEGAASLDEGEIRIGVFRCEYRPGTPAAVHRQRTTTSRTGNLE